METKSADMIITYNSDNDLFIIKFLGEFKNMIMNAPKNSEVEDNEEDIEDNEETKDLDNVEDQLEENRNLPPYFIDNEESFYEILLESILKEENEEEDEKEDEENEEENEEDEENEDEKEEKNEIGEEEISGTKDVIIHLFDTLETDFEINVDKDTTFDIEEGLDYLTYYPDSELNVYIKDDKETAVKNIIKFENNMENEEEEEEIPIDVNIPEDATEDYGLEESFSILRVKKARNNLKKGVYITDLKERKIYGPFKIKTKKNRIKIENKEFAMPKKILKEHIYKDIITFGVILENKFKEYIKSVAEIIENF